MLVVLRSAYIRYVQNKLATRCWLEGATYELAVDVHVWKPNGLIGSMRHPRVGRKVEILQRAETASII